MAGKRKTLKKWRKNRKPASLAAAASTATQPAGGALVPADDGPVRAAAEGGCRRAMRDLAKARARLEEFERADKPAFSLWYHGTFGLELSLLREWTRKADALEASIKGRKARRGGGPGDAPPRKAPPPPGGVKSAYRTLAKKLHPDSRRGRDAHRDGLWHRVQAAYEQGDLEELRALAALCDAGAEDPMVGKPVSSLLALEAEQRERLASLRKRTLKAKRDPAWGFSRDPAVARDLEPLLRREIEEAMETERRRCGDLTEKARRAGRPTGTPPA